jgi:hypothetical protein
VKEVHAWAAVEEISIPGVLYAGLDIGTGMLYSRRRRIGNDDRKGYWRGAETDADM